MTKQERDKLISSGVRGYLRYFAQEVFEGQVTTNSVVAIVSEDIRYLGMHVTPRDLGMIYDAIQEHGPVGENQHEWLAMQTRRQYTYEPGMGMGVVS